MRRGQQACNLFDAIDFTKQRTVTCSAFWEFLGIRADLQHLPFRHLFLRSCFWSPASMNPEQSSNHMSAFADGINLSRSLTPAPPSITKPLLCQFCCLRIIEMRTCDSLLFGNRMRAYESIRAYCLCRNFCADAISSVLLLLRLKATSQHFEDYSVETVAFAYKQMLLFVMSVSRVCSSPDHFKVSWWML